MNDQAARTVAVARGLILDMVEHRGQGHPGTAMSLAPLFYVLFAEVLKVEPSDAEWFDRDRLVLSSGHAAAVLYAYLHLAGFDLGIDDLEAYRKWGSRTPGHPEAGRTPGVDATTGALGQGLGNAVGMAVAESILRAEFGSGLCNHRTFVVAGEGDLQEGISHEVAALAGHWGLNRLTCVYNRNDLTLEGAATISMSDDVGQRFASYGWSVFTVSSGESLSEIRAALDAANADTERPSLIVISTSVATPAPTMTGARVAHGAPLGSAETEATKRVMGLDAARSFQTDPLPRDGVRPLSDRNAVPYAEWNSRASSCEGDRLRSWILGEVDSSVLEAALERAQSRLPDRVSARNASQAVVDELIGAVPWLVIGSADLSEGTGLAIPSVPWYSRVHPSRHLAYGIREHGMTSIMTGISLHGGLTPIGSTYLAFSDYLRPALRLAASQSVPLILVLTHDGFDGAEDGPTHHGVEHVESLRCVPGVEVVRPADAVETAAAWRRALVSPTPICIVLSREPVDRLGGGWGDADMEPRALDEVSDPDPDLVLLADGFQVHVAIETSRRLRARGVRSRVITDPRGVYRRPSEDADRALPVYVFRSDGVTEAFRGAVATGGRQLVRESGSAEELRRHAGLDPEILEEQIIADIEGEQPRG